MFIDDLKARSLPAVVPEGMTADNWPVYRGQVLDLFRREVYGYSPPGPASVHSETKASDPRGWAGKAAHREVVLSFAAQGGIFHMPVHLVLPACEKKIPLFVYISFTPYPCGQYSPIEEIVDQGYGLAIIDYNDVTEDKNDGFTSGIAAMYDRGAPDGYTWGKISMWAWAASRVMDFVQSLDQVDQNRIFCAGHSRLGKTALWCVAQDERFAGAAVNNSGAGGLAVFRGKQGERAADLVDRFPYWFCANFQQYANREHEMTFEQSMLAATVAPRLLAACSAEEDIWADPQSEYMALFEASKAYDLLGAPGFIAPGEYPSVGDEFLEGNLAYRLRSGTHFLSRHDWMAYIRHFNKK